MSSILMKNIVLCISLFFSTTEDSLNPSPYTDPVTSRPEFIVPVVLLVLLVVLGVVGGGVYYKYNKR